MEIVNIYLKTLKESHKFFEPFYDLDIYPTVLGETTATLMFYKDSVMFMYSIEFADSLKDLVKLLETFEKSRRRILAKVDAKKEISDYKCC